MTLREALNNGYRMAEAKYQRGYVSRKLTQEEIGDLSVQIAGGSRKGQLYVNLPCYHSTRYCVRQYLRGGER